MILKNRLLYIITAIIDILVLIISFSGIIIDDKTIIFSNYINIIFLVAILLNICFGIANGIFFKKYHVGFGFGLIVLFFINTDISLVLIWLCFIFYSIYMIINAFWNRKNKLTYGLYDWHTYQIYINSLSFLSIFFAFLVFSSGKYLYLFIYIFIILLIVLLYNLFYYKKLEFYKKKLFKNRTISNNLYKLYYKNEIYLSNETKGYFLLLFSYEKIFNGNYKEAMSLFDKIEEVKYVDLYLKYEIKALLLLLLNNRTKESIEELKRFSDIIKKSKKASIRKKYEYFCDYLLKFYKNLANKKSLPPLSSKYDFIELEYYDNYLCEDKSASYGNGLYLIFDKYVNSL